MLLAVSAAAQAADFPTASWRESKPEAQGLDSAELNRLSEAFAGGKHGYIDSLLVIRNGHVVFDRSYPQDYVALFAKAPDKTRGLYNYYDPEWHPYYKKTPLHTLQSVSKSVTSALLGIALRRGDLSGVDVPAAPFFEAYRVAAAEDGRWRALRLKHLLTMTAGIKWDESTVAYTDPANSCAVMEASKDWVQYVLEQPMAADPGTRFVYSSGVTELLAQVLKKATGRHADEYAAEHLFPRLGIKSFEWKKTPTGHPDTEGGLYLAPRDLARFGYLYLKDGVWAGERLLPEGWVAASTAPDVDIPNSPMKYGYQWWVLPEAGGQPRAYAAIGYGGQRMWVVPDLQLIAVFTGWNVYEKPSLDPVFALESVLKAVKQPWRPGTP